MSGRRRSASSASSPRRGRERSRRAALRSREATPSRTGPIWPALFADFSSNGPPPGIPSGFEFIKESFVFERNRIIKIMLTKSNISDVGSARIQARCLLVHDQSARRDPAGKALLCHSETPPADGGAKDHRAG